MTCVSRALSRIESCAVPGMFSRGGGGGGGGGGSGPTARKQSGCFFSPQTYFTVYRGGPMVLLQRQLYFSKDPEGFQHFQGGGDPGIRTPHPPPLDPHMRIYMVS